MTIHVPLICSILKWCNFMFMWKCYDWWQPLYNGLPLSARTSPTDLEYLPCPWIEEFTWITRTIHKLRNKSWTSTSSHSFSPSFQISIIAEHFHLKPWVIMILYLSFKSEENLLRHQARGWGGDILVLPLSILWATFCVEWRLRGRGAIRKFRLSDVWNTGGDMTDIYSSRVGGFLF